eukprot:149585-Hanusia_phi.AAC.1
MWPFVTVAVLFTLRGLSTGAGARAPGPRPGRRRAAGYRGGMFKVTVTRPRPGPGGPGRQSQPLSAACQCHPGTGRAARPRRSGRRRAYRTTAVRVSGSGVRSGDSDRHCVALIIWQWDPRHHGPSRRAAARRHRDSGSEPVQSPAGRDCRCALRQCPRGRSGPDRRTIPY